MWHICGHTLEAGEKKQIDLEPGVKDYIIPTTLVCGAKPGKTLLVTAGIHAGEYPGTAAGGYTSGKGSECIPYGRQHYIYALRKYQRILGTYRGDHPRGRVQSKP